MKRCASVTFAGVLAPGERDGIARSLASAGALVTSWTDAGGRSYAAIELAAPGRPEPLPPAAERFDEPALVVLRVTPRDVARVADLERAFAGAGRPRGVVAATREDGALALAFAPNVTSLAFVLALVDAVLETSPERTIEALLPLDDSTLADCAGALLGEPHLDAARILETHLEPFLARESA